MYSSFFFHVVLDRTVQSISLERRPTWRSRFSVTGRFGRPRKVDAGCHYRARCVLLLVVHCTVKHSWLGHAHRARSRCPCPTFREPCRLSVVPPPVAHCVTTNRAVTASATPSHVARASATGARRIGGPCRLSYAPPFMWGFGGAEVPRPGCGAGSPTAYLTTVRVSRRKFMSAPLSCSPLMLSTTLPAGRSIVPTSCGL